MVTTLCRTTDEHGSTPNNSYACPVRGIRLNPGWSREQYMMVILKIKFHNHMH